MKIKRITLPSSRKNDKRKDATNVSTSNRFIRTQDGNPYINTLEAHKILQPLPSPVIKVEGGNKILGIKRFLNDKSYGLNWFLSKLDLNIEVSEEQREQYILDAASVYLFKKPGKFTRKENLDMNPEDFEDPDDWPPIDKGLSEINMTTKDFKLNKKIK